jgi:TonB family protein
MRVGVVQSGRLVEERLLTERTVSVGRTARSTVIVAGDGLPPRWRLFERRRGRYRVRLAPAMRAKVSDGTRVVELGGGGPLVLPPGARGRIALGEVVILFQIVTRPEVPVTRLPHALRRSAARDLDRPFALLAALSFIAHLTMVLYLRGVDWPRQPDPAELPDRFVHQPLHRPTPAPPAPAPAAPVVAHRQPAPSRPRPSIEEQRHALIEKVGRKGLLQVLSALGPQGSVRDLLRDGAVDRAQEQAMREVGGVTVAQEGMALPLGPGPSGGRVADVTGLREGAHIAAADVTGPRAERHVPVIRTEPPALDEPVAGFDAQLLGRTIRNHLSEIRACYERALKQHATLGGKLLLRFTLTPAGTVATVDVDEDTLHDPVVTACVKAAILRWRFTAPPPRQIEITFPFIFQPAA